MAQNRSVTRRTVRHSSRLEGRIVHVGHSRSADFWAILKTDSNDEYFAYGRSFVNPKPPAIGQRFTFTPLPPTMGSKYLRAIEILPAQRLHEPDAAQPFTTS